MRNRRTTRHQRFNTVIVLAAVSNPGWADSLDDARQRLSELISAADVATGYAALINFTSEPQISSSNLRIDSGLANDDELHLTKLPLRYEFDYTTHRWKPFLQATLARMTYDQVYDLVVEVFPPEELKSSYESYSVTLGSGVRIPLSDRWSLLPAIDAGYASISSKAKYSGPVGERLFKPVFDGILFDWSADAWVGNGHLEVQYAGEVSRVQLETTFSYTLSHIQSYRTTSEIQTFRENMGTMAFKMRGVYPLGISTFSYPLSLIGRLGHGTFVGANRDTLGFNDINELGLSLQADISRYSLPVTSLSLGAMGLWGTNVKGWSILFGYEF